jgi:hypothetical protein
MNKRRDTRIENRLQGSYFMRMAAKPVEFVPEFTFSSNPDSATIFKIHGEMIFARLRTIYNNLTAN